MDTRQWIPGRARQVRKNVFSLGSARAALIMDDVNESEMSAPFVVSTIDEDREKDIVEPEGCLPYLADYEKNPIVLFDHDQHQVVGTSKDKFGRFHFRVSKRDIRATCFFHDCLWKGIPIGVETFHLVRKGIFRGASISFLPVKQRSRGYSEDDGMHYQKWKPTEWSICPLQSNQNALVEEAADELRAVLDRGEIKVKSFASHLRKTYLPPVKVWSPGADMPRQLHFSKSLFTRHEANRALRARGIATSGPTETADAWLYLADSSGRLEQIVSKGITMTKPEDDVTPPPEETETPPAPEEATEVPSGVETGAKYIVHFEHFLNDLEARESEANPKTKELFAKLHADVEQIMADLRSHVETEYPDHDVEGVADGYRPETEPVEKDDDIVPEEEPEEDDELAPVQKKLGSQHRPHLGACRDFLRDMPKSDKVHKSLHSACLLHAKNLEGMMPEEEEGEDDGGEMVQKLLDRFDATEKKLTAFDALATKAQEVGVLA